MLKVAWNNSRMETRDLNTNQAPAKLVRQSPDKYFCVKALFLVGVNGEEKHLWSNAG